MSILDIDPNSVNAGWIPLALTVLLGVAVFLIFRSMRRQLGRIQLPEDQQRVGDTDAAAPRTPAEKA